TARRPARRCPCPHRRTARRREARRMTATLTLSEVSALAPLPLSCTACGHHAGASPQAICPECLGPLEPVYDPSRALPTREEIATRPRSLWRYHEWLPFGGA